ncbi:MAG: ribosome silencing factor [Nitrospira sp.]|nr:ribosome silencing factor [Nitrospira sp.]MCB9709807.1 ribosome silencing factor [Nitrospiraceae bacterium]MDR4486031.1 ribosome silencing factor [Nitrospirales bacterium]MCA9464028.1 ribosome silencing factor [Nitrospira sp.]MCA9474810.1 ribosome silencing factor [Nitrospira sp.]
MPKLTHSPSFPSQEKAIFIAQAAQEKQAGEVLILEVGHLTSIADYFVFGSGESERQVRAIATFIEKEVSARFHEKPQVEGKETSKWILLDFGDVIVHVFKTEVRQYYALEKMWADAPQIDIPEAETTFRQPVKSAKGPPQPKVAR